MTKKKLNAELHVQNALFIVFRPPNIDINWTRPKFLWSNCPHNTLRSHVWNLRFPTFNRLIALFRSGLSIYAINLAPKHIHIHKQSISDGTLCVINEIPKRKLNGGFQSHQRHILTSFLALLNPLHVTNHVKDCAMFSIPRYDLVTSNHYISIQIKNYPTQPHTLSGNE